MVIEIGELNHARQSTRWTGRVGDSLHIAAVAYRAGQKHERAELYRAYTSDAQLADREIGALQHVVQPRSNARMLRHRGGHTRNVIEQRAASI
jgi:hypothetical protein